MIDAYDILQKKHPNTKLIIVGNGDDLDKAKKHVVDKKVKNVLFKGGLFGVELTTQFKNAQLYVLPSYHGEGMPTSVLEAMAFGMPIITRPLGGLNDFFEQNLMGSLIASLDPKEFAIEIEKYILDSDLTHKTALHNNDYAIKRFMASKVAENIELDIDNSLN